MLKSYRARLVFYIIILMLFLSGVVTYSYFYIYNLVTHETETHIARLAKSSVSSLNQERYEMEHFASIIANDLRLREYMFVVTQIGGEAPPLKELYDRNFSSLPIDSFFIVDSHNHFLVGSDSWRKEYALKHFPAFQENTTPRSFYLNDRFHFEFVAVSKITYRDHLLGYLAITRHIDKAQLLKLQTLTGGQIFIINNHKIISSTLESAIDKPFTLQNNLLNNSGEVYRTHRIMISDEERNLPQIWLGIPETQLLASLREHRIVIFTIMTTGILAILLTGILLIRNFHRPLSALMRLTREIGKGNFPNLKKTQAQNEIDELSNHFVDMVSALKEKQKEIEQAHNALRKSAITDSLTGLHNRRYLQMIFAKMLAQADREHKFLGAIILDIDHFKKVNDTYGHLAGDICLANFADLLRTTSRANDDVFRLGGEEFLILTISDDIAGIKSFAEKLRNTIEESLVTYQNHEIRLTISAGISVASQHGNEQDILNQLLAQADEVLYKAKHNGRNRVEISPVVPHTSNITRQSN